MELLCGVSKQHHAVRFGAAYEFLDLGSAEIKDLHRPAGTLTGGYSSNYVHFVALNLIWKF
jgi:hypothetical protein